MSGWKVQLAVYDISMGMASQMSMALLGEQIEAIYHTGIIVYGKEFFFGGGIQQCPHEQFVSAHGGIRPIQMLDLGTTDVPEDVFQDFLREISPRFTMATYDLIKNNCNNFTDACSDFLLGKGIPQHIVGLPERVFSTPLGQMLRPMIENMQNSINTPGGGMTLDPFANSGATIPPSVPAASAAPAPAPSPPPVPAGWVTSPAAAPGPAPASSQQPATSAPEASGATFSGPPSTPTLDKYSKPLLSADRNGVKSIVDGLKKKVEHVDGLSLSEAQLQVLDGIADATTAKTAVPEGTAALLTLLMSEGPATLHFSTLCVLRVAVLPPMEGIASDMETVLRLLLTKLREDTITSLAAVVMGLCVLTNLFATEAGLSFLLTPDVLEGCLDLALQKLHHERTDVRLLACTVLHNYALHLPPTEDNTSAPDQATQILLGVVEGLENEIDEQSCLRRCLSVGHLIKKYGTSMAGLIVELEFDAPLRDISSAQRFGEETRAVAAEIISLV